MKAIVQNGYGSPDVMRLAEIDRPAVKRGDVLVEVRAAGVDRGTLVLMAGQPYATRLSLGLRGPRDRVAGLDLAGTVAAVGDGVTGFAVGDEVYGTGRGSFAEFAAADPARLARKPAGLSFEQAAAVPVSGVTALRALRDVGRLQAGQHVLVIGASGGVGTFAVQLAKAFGAEVTGVCRTEKVELVRSLGADHVVDHRQEDFAAAGRRYDLVLDIGGDSGLSRLRGVLTPRGTLVIVGGDFTGKLLGMGRAVRALMLSRLVRQRLTTFVAPVRSADLATLAELIESGRVKPAIDSTFALAEAPEALRRLESGQVKGKVTIVV
jgi:NADPH:quinone reductase-like Zn-dependent oxidoreductase